jgi:hypothetical protein
VTEVANTLRQRGAQYGPFEDQALVEQRIKSSMRTGNWDRLAPDQKAALEMIAVKVSRILTGNPDYPDNWHDMAGYATLVDRRLEAELAAE